MTQLRLVSAIGWGFSTWNEREQLQLLADCGISNVQLFRNKDNPPTPAEVRSVLDDFNASAVSMHAFFGTGWDVSHPDKSERQKVLDGLRREADYARQLGAELMVIHPGAKEIGDETHSPQRLDAIRNAAPVIDDIGRSFGLVMALENLPPGYMGDDMAMLRRIADEIDSPHLGLNFDLGHAQLVTADPSLVARQAGPRMAGTHIHDNTGSGDEHLVPGYGVIDMDAICRTLAEINYRGDFTLELMETVDAIRRQATPEWLKKLHRWVALAGAGDN